MNGPFWKRTMKINSTLGEGGGDPARKCCYLDIRILPGPGKVIGAPVNPIYPVTVRQVLQSLSGRYRLSGKLIEPVFLGEFEGAEPPHNLRGGCGGGRQPPPPFGARDSERASSR